MPPTELLREHLAQAERHVSELRAHIAQQRRRVRDLSIKDQLHEQAVQMLAMLEDTLRISEQHGELIRSWLARGDQVTGQGGAGHYRRLERGSD
jgi:hypothetical protein